MCYLDWFGTFTSNLIAASCSGALPILRRNGSQRGYRAAHAAVRRRHRSGREGRTRGVGDGPSTAPAPRGTDGAREVRKLERTQVPAKTPARYCESTQNLADSFRKAAI